MKLLPSAPSGARLAVMAALAALLARPAVGQATTPTFVQGTAFSTGDRVLTTTVTLTSPVAGGDLLVGWFSQYNDPGQVQVSDDVNGAWARAPWSLHFLDDTGDIALYYRESSQAAPGGMTVTVSAASAAYLQGTVADYSGVALAGSLAQIVTARAPDAAAVDTGATAAVDAGELVFAAQRQRRRLHRVPRRFRHRDDRARHHDLPRPERHASEHLYIFGRRLRPRERSFGTLGLPHGQDTGPFARIRPGRGLLAPRPPRVV